MSAISGFFIGLTLLFGSLYYSTLGFLHITQNSTSTATTTLQWVSISKSTNNTYIVKNGAIYSQTNYLVSGADMNSFLVWSGSGAAGNFAKDNTNVYSWGGLIKGADPKTVEILYASQGFTGYFKDKNHVYYDFYVDGTAPVAGTDSATFSLIDCDKTQTVCSYDAQDKNNKYLNGEIVQPVSQSSANTSNSLEQVICYTDQSHCANNPYFTDGENIYYKSDNGAFTLLKGVATSTFDYEAGFDASYDAKGNGLKYLNGKIVDELQGLPNGYSRDGTNVYFNGKIITNADLLTFFPVSGQSTYDAQDKNHKYLQGKIVQ